MSEQLNHKLINFEVAPPNTVWDAIAQRLDDDNRYAVLSHKLENFETTLPDNIWSAIAERLHDDNQYAAVVSKFKNHEVNPPAAAWDNIASNLPEGSQQSSSFVSRLQYFEAAPPPNAWNNIADVLSEDKKAQAPVIKLSSYIYKVGAAAIVIGLLIGGWLLMNNKQPAKTDLAKNSGTPSTNKEEKTNSLKTTIATDSQPAEQQNNVAINQPRSPHHVIKHDEVLNADNTTTPHELKPADVKDLLAYQQKPIVIASAPIVDKEGNVIRDMDVLTTSNYIMVTGPNGQATRMSSKFVNVIRYLNGENNGTEEYLDRVIIESNAWKKRFQEWRNKISQSSYIPSSSNFLDIVEFKELIQEKQ